MILFARKAKTARTYSFRSQANTSEEAKARTLTKFRLWVSSMSKEGKKVAVDNEQIRLRQVNTVCWECDMEVAYRLTR